MKFRYLTKGDINQASGIIRLNVTPKYQGNGIGTELIKHIIAAIRKDKNAKIVFLSAAKGGLYDKFDFKGLTRFGKNSLMALKLR